MSIPRILFAALALLLPAVAHAQPGTPRCDMAAASPWIERWLSAWELTSREILKLPDAPAPGLVFFDSACVYTTMQAVAPAAKAGDGPSLHGRKLVWRAAAHDDSLTLPNGDRIPVGIVSFANHDRTTGPYFLMSAPSLWEQRGITKPGDPPTSVFIHEFAHTRQIDGMRHIIGRIDSTWTYPEELDDDAVQTHFGHDSAYVKEYLAERDLLYRAAAAGTADSAKALARQALAMIRSRHAKWFTGDKAEFAILDDTWLSMEGAAQWSAVAWLAHPKGGGMTKDAAVAKMIGRQRRWTQDEGLALFLVVDRLVPEWPRLVFTTPSAGALALLERAAK